MNPKVPFVNYPRQYRLLKREIDKAIFRVLKNGDLILRSDVEKFEKNVARFLDTKYGIGVNSCTDAMILALKAAGIGRGDEVITVSHTFFATIEAIHHLGAKPILIDVKEDFLMDETKLEQAISSKTKAILPVHLNGRVCNMQEIMRIAKKHKLIVIEDAAQALGAEFQGKKAGSFGLAGCFSFYPAKLLGGAGDGGLVVTNNPKTARKVWLLRHHCQAGKDKIVCYGFTSRLHNIQAAILNVKFRYLSKWIKRRRVIARMYERGFWAIPQIKTPPALDSDKKHFDVYQNYVVRVQKRDRLRDFLKKKGVETLIKDPIPNHRQKGLGLSRFCLPLTEELAKEIISLPMYPELTDQQVRYVINCLKEFYK